MFEDESQNVIRKAKNESHTTAHKPSSCSSNKYSGPSNVQRDLERDPARNTQPDAETSYLRDVLLTTDKSTPQDRSASSLERALTPAFEVRGLAFFDAFFVLVDGPAVRDDLGDTLISCMRAVGLAGLSNYARASEMRREARRLYLEAIQHINAALRSPTQAKEDSTLLSVTILSQFEVLDDSSSHSLIAWENHINGAAALLKLRGPEALRTPTGVRLFIQVTSSVMAICLKHKLPLPDIISPLAEEVSKHVIRSDPGWRYFDTYRRITEYYARIRRGLVTDVYQVLALALELDRLAVESFSNIPPRWYYAIVPTTADPDVVFSGYYHVYDSFISAYLWNSLRTLRMLLHEIIRRTIIHDRYSTPPYSTPHQFQTSTEILSSLQADILASVPQNIGYVSHKEKHPTDRSTSYLESWEPQSSGPAFPWLDFRSHDMIYEIFDMAQWDDSLPRYRLPLTRMLGGTFLPWALYTAGMVDVATDDVRRWCSRILRFMEAKMGIRQAAALADEVDKTVGTYDILPF